MAEKHPETILNLITSMGAVVDFSVASKATLDLNGISLNKNIVPSHTITSVYGNKDHVQALVDQKDYVMALVAFLVDALTEKLIYNDTNDIVVPTLS